MAFSQQAPWLGDASWESVSPRTRDFVHGQGHPCHHPNAGYLSSPVASQVYSWRREGSLPTDTLGMKNVRAAAANDACSAHQRVHENSHCVHPSGGLWEHCTGKALAISKKFSQTTGGGILTLPLASEGPRYLNRTADLVLGSPGRSFY